MKRSRKITLVLMTAIPLTLTGGISRAQHTACVEATEACKEPPRSGGGASAVSWWRPWAWNWIGSSSSPPAVISSPTSVARTGVTAPAEGAGASGARATPTGGVGAARSGGFGGAGAMASAGG